MSSFLFTLWAGGGNVPPQVALARRLVARGHRVGILAPDSLRQRVEEAGATFHPYREAPQHDEAHPEQSLLRDFEAKTPAGALKMTRERLLVGLAEPIAHDTDDLLSTHGYEVVAPDWLLIGGAYAAERRGLPVAPLVHSVLSLPAEGMPPFGFGWQPAPGRTGRMRDRLGTALFELMLARPLLEPLNHVRRGLGLDPVSWAFEHLFTADRLLVLTSAAFDYPARFPETVEYVGAQLDDPEWHPQWATPWDADDPRPLVVVSLSTTYQAHERLLSAVVEAVGSLPVRALVTTGPALSLPSAPDNVRVESYVPHPRVLPLADLVVTHAGHGTTLAALAHGVPLVCLPVSRDQPDIAARVTWHGAGVRLSPRTSRKRIARAMADVLDGDGYREAAGRLQTAIAAEGPLRAVEAVERLGSRSDGARRAKQLAP